MTKESVTKVENMEWRDGHYTGDINDGVPDGSGTYTYPNKGAGHGFGITTYEGEFEDGEYHGQGTVEPFLKSLLYYWDHHLPVNSRK